MFKIPIKSETIDSHSFLLFVLNTNEREIIISTPVLILQKLQSKMCK